MKNSTFITKIHLDKDWHKCLTRYKSKRISLFARFCLWWRGIRDGARGYPRIDTGGKFSSPFIQKEISDYQARCSRMWFDLQQMEQDQFVQLQQLVYSLHTVKEKLVNNQATLVTTNCTNAVLQRHKGESNLTDLQVQARRDREQTKVQSLIHQKIQHLENSAETLAANVYALYAQLVEDANTIHMLTEKEYSHTLQRIAIYWDAALSRLPDNQSVPHTYGELIPGAETIYIQAHQEKMDTLLHEIKKEVA